MSVWVVGSRYRYCGAVIVCVRRYFDGPLELVDLAFEQDLQATTHGLADLVLSTFTRTARALAPCVVPRVTQTLGGVMRPDVCDHRYQGEPFVADAGPNQGSACCPGCGGKVSP